MTLGLGSHWHWAHWGWIHRCWMMLGVLVSWKVVVVAVAAHRQRCWWWGDVGAGWSLASGSLGLDFSSLDDAGGAGVVEGHRCRHRSTLTTTLVVG